MPNQTIQSYLEDNTVDLAKREKVLGALKAGQDEGKLAEMISQKYPQYKSATGPAPGAAPSIPGYTAVPDVGGKAPSIIERVQQGPAGELAGNVAEAVKAGVLKGGEGVQKVGAAVTGDTAELEGYRQFYGIKKPEEYSEQKLSPEERGLIAGEGITETVSGTLEGAFSPVTGTIESVEPLKAIAQPVFAAIGEVAQAGSGQFKNALKGAGVELSPEQEAVIDEGMANLTNLFLIKATENVGKYKSLETAKAKSYGLINEAMKKGDLGKVKTIISDLEGLASKTAPLTGRTIGSALEGVKSITRPFAEGLKGTAGSAGVIAGEMAGKVLPSTKKAINALEQDYYKWSGATKAGVKKMRAAEARTLKMDKSGTTGRAPQRVLAESGIIPKTEGTKFSTMDQAIELRGKIEPYVKAQQEAVAAAEKTTAPIKTAEFMEKVIEDIRTKENVASGKAAKLEAEIRREFNNYKKEYGEEMLLSTVNEIKSARWKDSKFDFTQPLKGDVNYAIAKAAQKSIEKTAKKAGLDDVAQLNREIGDVLEASKFLESLDGNTLKGGRLGKYAFGTIGAIGGTSIGPVGTFLGAVGGNVIADLLMKRSVSPIVRRTILKAIKDKDPVAFTKVKEWMKSPEAKQRLLESPKKGSSTKIESTETVELPAKTGSTIEAQEAARIAPQKATQEFVEKALTPQEQKLLQAPKGEKSTGEPISLHSRSQSTIEAKEKLSRS